MLINSCDISSKQRNLRPTFSLLERLKETTIAKSSLLHFGSPSIEFHVVSVAEFVFCLFIRIEENSVMSMPQQLAVYARMSCMWLNTWIIQLYIIIYSILGMYRKPIDVNYWKSMLRRLFLKTFKSSSIWLSRKLWSHYTSVATCGNTWVWMISTWSEKT